MSDVPTRRTRSSSKAIMDKTLEKEKSEEDGKLLEKSTDLSKEEYVKSYSLRPRPQPKTHDKSRSENTETDPKQTDMGKDVTSKDEAGTVHNDELADPS